MRKLIVGLVMLVMAAFLAACGGQTGPAPVSLVFDGDDMFRYTPSSATVESGASVTVTFNNVGVLEHNWVLIPDSVDPIQATEADALPGAVSGMVASNGVSTFTFTAPAPGEYKFVCTVPGHAVGGMVGAFTVR